MDVAQRVAACIQRWQLEPAGRLTGGFHSDVMACTLADGTAAVLKLTPTPQEARVEAAALDAWADSGAAVRLIDADLTHSALLLERVLPGTPLPGNDDPATVTVVAGLLDRLHRAPRPGLRFPPLLDTYVHMERAARDDAHYEQRTRKEPSRGQPGLHRLARARAAAVELSASSDRDVLLHGDFLDKNLLRSGAGYVAIDPIPHLGDPCADVGFFAAGHPPAAGILPRAAELAEVLGLDQHRAQRWAAVWTVLQTCQAWRDDQDALEACVASREVDRLLDS